MNKKVYDGLGKAINMLLDFSTSNNCELHGFLVMIDEEGNFATKHIKTEVKSN